VQTNGAYLELARDDIYIVVCALLAGRVVKTFFILCSRQYCTGVLVSFSLSLPQCRLFFAF